MLLTAVKAKFYSSSGQSLIDYSDTDKVFIHKDHLPQLGTNKLNDERRRPILTISCNGKKIYRQFKQGSKYGICNGQIALLDKDSSYLDIKDDNVYVEVKKSTLLEKIKYYINNPRQELRISIVFGLITFSFQMFYEFAKDLYSLLVSN